MSEQKDILQINIPLPTKSLDEKKKNTRDVEMMIKRRLNRDIKEQRAYLHKVSLLCHIAHGLYCNKVLNNPSLMAAALKLLPNKSCYPDGATCIKYFESIAKWFKQAIPIRKNQMYLGTNKRPKLGVSLALQIKYKEALCKKDFVLIFIILLRAMGIPCRLVINLTPFSIRPPQSELHSLSTKPKDEKVEQEKKVKTNRKGTENKEIDSTESSKKHAVSHKRHEKKPEKSSEHDQKSKAEKRKEEKTTKRDEKVVKNIEKAGEEQKKSVKSKEDSEKGKKKGSEKKELHSDKSNKKKSSKNTERTNEKTKNAKPQKNNETDGTVLTLPKEISQTISESIVVSNSKQVSETVTTSLGACVEPTSKTEQNHPEISNITKSALKQDLSAENVEPLSEKLEIVPEKSKCGGEMVMNSDCPDAPLLLSMVKTESNEDSITIGPSEIPGTVENTVKTSSSPLPPIKEEITESTKTSLSQKLKRNVKNKKTTATTSNEGSGEPAEMETEHFKELQKNVPKRKKANTKQNDANELPTTTTKKRGAKVESIYFQIPTRRTTRSRAKQQDLEGTEQPTIPQMDGADDNTRVNLKKLKPKSRRPSNSDDDFVPSPPKKPRPSTAHTSSKGSRSKKERQVLSSSSEEDEKVKKNKMDVWVEVFSEKEEKWVPINLFKTQVDNPDELRVSFKFISIKL